MEKKKIHYGWYIVIGCLLITCTMVPPIMALSNKFLIQVTEELGLSRSGFTLANTILQGLGILFPLWFLPDLQKAICVKSNASALSDSHSLTPLTHWLRMQFTCISPLYSLEYSG